MGGSPTPTVQPQGTGTKVGRGWMPPLMAGDRALVEGDGKRVEVTGTQGYGDTAKDTVKVTGTTLRGQS